MKLSESNYQHFKQALLAQKNALQKEAEKTVEEGLNVDSEDLADSIDRSSVETERNFTLKLRDRERKLIKKIDEALERLEAGSFGVCEVCEEDISLNRLKARPIATLCIECKEEQEKQEKHNEQ
ncbi:MAG: RNA polymerase-binding protein DksA [Nitrospinota bacterium]|nr:RNA polymerase-binding protein DksA [Nitrospinota bacterium]MDH5678670.1 RNA polymerase-binding protein DksA [Nitrospinota bacterium]MDH5756895.1 RNA polymerase-binding protein DksA [Nitrospinota bacterium]